MNLLSSVTKTLSSILKSMIEAKNNVTKKHPGVREIKLMIDPMYIEQLPEKII